MIDCPYSKYSSGFMEKNEYIKKDCHNVRSLKYETLDWKGKKVTRDYWRYSFLGVRITGILIKSWIQAICLHILVVSNHQGIIFMQRK